MRPIPSCRSRRASVASPSVLSSRSSGGRWGGLVRRRVGGLTVALFLGAVGAFFPSWRSGLEPVWAAPTVPTAGSAWVVRVLSSAGRELSGGKGHVAFSRQLPSGLSAGNVPRRDPEAFEVEVEGDGQAVPTRATVRSFSPKGKLLDLLEVKLLPSPCAGSAGRTCGRSAALRTVGDAIDRFHPASLDNTVMGEVGGSLEVVVEGAGAEGAKTSSRVEAPRVLLPVAAPELAGVPRFARLRGRLSVTVVRATGSVSKGDDEGAVITALRRELARANSAWGQCGIHFGDPESLPIAVVDPPVDHLVSVGCELGLPALGGKAGIRVAGRDVVVPAFSGESPASVARRLMGKLQQVGMKPRLWLNPRTGQGALATADLSVSDARGRRLPLEPWHGDGEDARLQLCIGHVELSDGLHHFVNSDAEAGTLEERTLLRAVTDDDPRTIDVVVVPSFDEEQRIGESFMAGEHGSLRAIVILDRTGLQAGELSLTLAHELGHVLLNEAGHPDAWGADTPSLLMDSDALDASIFGPRRLSAEECQRAWRESGPQALHPLLEDWPL